MRLDLTKKNKKINILDCTLRDGGYYNNWNFSLKLINKYLDALSKSNIRNIEIGFRSLIKDNKFGNTAFTNFEFLNSLKIPKNINLGVMINSNEFISKKNKIFQFFSKKFNKKIKFIRLATHINDLLKIKEEIRWLKKHNYIVAVNIMQISEIKFKNIKKYCEFFKSCNVDIIYLADSLGCLRPPEFIKIFKLFQKNWKGEMGIHAHDNLNHALNNSLAVLNSGVSWIDGTIKGMGRGPGNVKTEILINKINSFKTKFDTNYKRIDQSLINDFEKLKKQYKWGTNQYYYYSGKNKIHPTYIQEILSNKKNKKKDILLLIKQLSKLNVKMFNPLNLHFLNYFIGKRKFKKFKPKDIFKNSKVLIIGPGNSVAKEKYKILKFIKKENPIIFFTNTVKNSLGLNNFYRVSCHPYRLITDFAFHKKNKEVLILPVTNLPKKILNSLINSKKNLLNFGLKISNKDEIKIHDTNCVMPQPLTIAYSISIALSANIKKIYLAGFDGYKKDDPFNDNTQKMLEIFKQKVKHKSIYSLTKTHYRI